MKKLVVTMCIGNWEPGITSLTFPLMQYYAKKINADFAIIETREYPDKPLCYERFQIYDIAKNYDWVIQLDADLLMHPDMPDVTPFIGKDTILMSSVDWAPKRFVMDHYFHRDGRYISVPGFFTVTSDWTREFWLPPDDLTPEQAMQNSTPCQHEWQGRKLGRSHVVLDYIFSRNVAKYGFKVESLQNLFKKLSQPGRMALGGIEDYVCHNSFLPIEHKRQHLKQVVFDHWKLNPAQLGMLND